MGQQSPSGGQPVGFAGGNGVVWVNVPLSGMEQQNQLHTGSRAAPSRCAQLPGSEQDISVL